MNIGQLVVPTNEYAIEIKVVHGDGDHYEKLPMITFKEEETALMLRVVQMLDELFEEAKKTGNDPDYHKVVGFEKFLQPHWVYDLYRREIDMYTFAHLDSYQLMFYDEYGGLREMSINKEQPLEKHRYMVMEDVKMKWENFYQGYIIVSVSPLGKETIENMKLKPLSEIQFAKENPDYFTLCEYKQGQLYDDDLEFFPIIEYWYPYADDVFYEMAAVDFPEFID
jgi:hypothetical protein